MANVVDDLIALGFNPRVDFEAQNDSDGNGPYIRAWLSDKPCPFPETIREPIAVQAITA